MKRKVFIVFCIFGIIVLIFTCYNFFIVGNNKNIDNINEFDRYISKIKNYNIEALVTVNSNKNSNTYSLKQEYKDKKVVQNIKSQDGIELTIENYDGKTVVKNTELTLDKVFR